MNVLYQDARMKSNQKSATEKRNGTKKHSGFIGTLFVDLLFNELGWYFFLDFNDFRYRNHRPV